MVRHVITKLILNVLDIATIKRMNHHYDIHGEYPQHIFSRENQHIVSTMRF